MQKDTGKYATSEKIISCLTNADNALTTDTTLSYIAATDAVQQKQVAANPDLKVWVEAVQAAKGRTSDNLGTKYPKISEPMWTALPGRAVRQQNPRRHALTAAQSTAAAATK